MIRELRKNDYYEYLFLLKQLNNMDIIISKEEFWLKYQLIKNTGGIIYVYIKDNCIVGTFKILNEYKFYDNIVHIEDVVVDKNFRYKGIGKYLMNEAMKLIPECYKVVINCKIDLFDFYISCGFDLEGHQFVKRI